MRIASTALSGIRGIGGMRVIGSVGSINRSLQCGAIVRLAPRRVFSASQGKEAWRKGGQFFIGGEWVAPAGGEATRWHKHLNPATEQVEAEVALGSPQDVDAAVAAASAAFEDWAATPLAARMAVLKRAVALYREQEGEFATCMTREMGAPASFSNEVQAPCGEGHLVATLEAAEAHEWVRLSNRGGSMLVDEPVGVCGLITPWNWPINQVVTKVAPALAAGCTVVLKPSELAPLSAALFAQLLQEAGCPRGVFNLVHGDGATGASLAEHKDVHLVSLTGSSAAGAAVTALAAQSVKRVSLELGGKSPSLVFADCDDAGEGTGSSGGGGGVYLESLGEVESEGGGGVEAAAQWTVRHCFINAGQSCDAASRLLVERRVYKRALAAAAAEAERTLVGDPSLAGNHMGPVISRTHWERVQGLIKLAIEEGAEAVAGGPGRPAEAPGDKGFFVRPTVFGGVSNAMTIAQREVFGPVLVVIPFDSEEEAVRLANDSPYGLAAYLHTGDAGRAARMARRLRAGSVSVNGGGPDYDVPFGGYKQSGNGRENGPEGLKEFLETKAISSNLDIDQSL